MSAIPGGNILLGTGGYITAAKYIVGPANPGSENQGSDPVNQGTPGEVGPDSPWRIDVAQWYVKQEFVSIPVSISGSYGARHRRTVVHDWYARVKLWWEFFPSSGMSPLSRLRNGDSLELVLYIGPGKAYIHEPWPQVLIPSQLKEFMTVDVSPNQPHVHPQYKSPLAVVTYASMVDSSEGDGIATQEIYIQGASHLYEITTNQDELNYGTYVDFIKHRISTGNDTRIWNP